MSSFVIRDDLNRRSNAMQRLRDAGLYVDSAGNSSLDNRISRSQDDIGWDFTTLTSRSLDSHIATDYWSNEWPWCFRRWLCMPGPALDDFECEFATVEAAVEAVLAFYFGHPTLIDDWLVPLHVHPELPEDGVRAVLGQAIVISANQFEVIQEERTDFVRRAAILVEERWQEVSALAGDDLGKKYYWEQIDGMVEADKLPPWTQPILGPDHPAFRRQFLVIHHVKDMTNTLRLRRDLGEAYIVSGG